MTATEAGLAQLMRVAPFTGAATLAAILLSRIYLLTGAGMGMNVWSMSPLRFPPMVPQHAMVMEQAGFLSLLLMWWVMMLAMMMPGTLRHLPIRSGVYGSVSLSTAAFWSGYAGVWFVFSVGAAVFQHLLKGYGLLHPTMMFSTSFLLSAGLLGIAGVVQFSPWKTKTLAACTRFSSSNGSFSDGITYGRHCLGSSAALMLLLFVFGAMNIYWVGILALLVAIEKFVGRPAIFSKAIGALCLAAAYYLLASSWF